MAGRSLGTLTIDLIAKTGGFSAGMTKAERSTDKWKKQATKDAKAVGAAVAKAGALVVTATVAMVGASIRNADQTRKTAQAVGLTTEAFSALTFAASQSGVEQAALVSSTNRLNKSILETSQGIGESKEVFDNLGISVKNASGEIKNGEEILKEIADKFQQMPDGVEKSAMALDVLGRSGAQLIPLLNGGSEGIEKLTDQAANLGLVISDQTAREAELFNDSLKIIASEATGTANTIASNLLPVMSEMAEAFAENTEKGGGAIKIGDNITESLKVLSKVAVGVTAAFDLLGTKIAGEFFILSQVPKGFDAVRAAVKMQEEEFNKVAEEYAKTLERINGIGNEASLDLGPDAPTNSPAAIPDFTPADSRGDDALTKKIESLQESFLLEEELLVEKYEKEKALLEEARAAELDINVDYDALGEKAKERHETAMTDLHKKEAQARLKATQGALGNLSSLMNSESRKAFEVGKAASLVNATISGYEAAVNSYAVGSRIGGPILGAAFATTALAATGVQIQAINNSSFGGGGTGGAASAGGGASTTAAVNAQTEQVNAAGGGGEQNVFIKGIGKDDLFSGAQLVELLNSELINGGKLILDD